MELKTYIRILMRKWWIVIPAFLITFASTMAFTFAQAPTYRATATFVMSPSGVQGDVGSFVNYLDIMSRRPEIANTYTEIAMSDQVRHVVVAAIGLSPAQNDSIAVESKQRAGTNIIEITAEGSDPVLIADFANRLGSATIAYVEKLYEAYQLSSLDPAIPPTAPLKPNKPLNLAVGATLGLVLGVALAFLSEYVQAPLEGILNVGILDEDTGAYNKRYFVQRLGEEMSRAKRNKYPLSLALMNIDHPGVMRASLSPQFRGEALRKVTVFLKQYLREEDVMARLEGTTFAFLLPDMTEEKAKDVMERLQTRMAWTAFEMEKSGLKLNLSGAAGVVAYTHNGAGQAELLESASHALRKAETTGYGKVSLYADSENTDDSQS